jgi:hypothetical protein
MTMAEFSEVMRQVERMCNELSCEDCPLDEILEECPIGDTSFNTGLASMEKLVMDWAAENPEPRYPTWREAWESLFPDMAEINPPCPRYFMDEDRAQEYCGVRCAICREKPIPADIAEKLGVKPKEG